MIYSLWKLYRFEIEFQQTIKWMRFAKHELDISHSDSSSALINEVAFA